MRRHILSMSMVVLPLVLGGGSLERYILHGKHMTHTLIHEGRERSYELYLPSPKPAQKKVPLLILLHGDGGSAKSLARLTQGRFNRIADEESLIVAYPEAVNGYWNDGRRRPVSFAHRHAVDDVGFLRSMIDAIRAKYPADPRRVYLVGVSNGGLMAYRMACEASEGIAAVAVVSASMPADLQPACERVAGTSLMIINGTEDPLLPYEGGMIVVQDQEYGSVLSTEATVALWLERNGCPGHAKRMMIPDRDPRDGTTVTAYFYAGCSGGVRVLLYRVEGGGHTWPGGRVSRRDEHAGRVSQDIDASEVIWSFFRQVDASTG